MCAKRGWDRLQEARFPYAQASLVAQGAVCLLTCCRASCSCWACIRTRMQAKTLATMHTQNCEKRAKRQKVLKEQHDRLLGHIA